MSTTQDPERDAMTTHFAPVARTSDEKLRDEIRFVIGNPILDVLLKSVGGLLAILNEQRQIIGINEGFGKLLGLSNVADVFGLRPGEAVHCVHAWENPAGCGTSESCATCGAVVAIVTCLGSNEPVERTCAINVQAGNTVQSLFFDIRACPLTLEGNRFVLVFLRNRTEDQHRATLSRVFFDEISGTIAGVLGRSKLMLTANADKARGLSVDIFSSLLKVAQEIRIQRRLVLGEKNAVALFLQNIVLSQVIQELESTFAGHPASKGKRLKITAPDPDLRFKTDICLLLRVLVGMILNAMEASQAGDEVRVDVAVDAERLTFSIWNRQVIPPEIIHRIFEQNFSTKPESGRGMGTYCMKLLGEESLGGKVSFTSTEAEGTTFRLTLKV